MNDTVPLADLTVMTQVSEKPSHQETTEKKSSRCVLKPRYDATSRTLNVTLAQKENSPLDLAMSLIDQTPEDKAQSEIKASQSDV